MARMKRGGRELVVADANVAEYLKMGYSVIDEHGNELTHTKAVTYQQAMLENVDLRARVKALTASLENANTKIVGLEAALAKASEPAKTGKRSEKRTSPDKEEKEAE